MQPNFCSIVGGAAADPAKDCVLLRRRKATIIRHVPALYFGINWTAFVINPLVGSEHAIAATVCMAARIFGTIRLNDRVYIFGERLGCAAAIFRVGSLRAETLGTT